MTNRGDGHPRRGRKHQEAQMLPLPGAQRRPRRPQGPPQPPSQPPQRPRYQPTKQMPILSGDEPPLIAGDGPPRGSRRSTRPPVDPPRRRDRARRMPPPSSFRRRRWPRVLGSIVGVILLLFVGIAIYLDLTIKRTDAIEDYSGRPAAGAGTNWLVVGSDSRAGLSNAEAKKLHTGSAKSVTGKRTDTIMIAHLPEGSAKPSLVSIPRDLYVNIPGYGQDRVNAAFSKGGGKLLVKTVEKLTGLHIDHYAEIGLAGFAHITDAVGGVQINVPQDMKDSYSGADFKKGKQKMNGTQALAFVRSRHAVGSDLNRVADQRQFIGALAKKMASPTTLLNPFRLFPMVGAIPDGLTIDSGDHVWNLLGLAWAMRGISSGGVITTTVPVDGTANNLLPKAQQLFKDLREDKSIPDSLVVNGA